MDEADLHIAIQSISKLMLINSKKMEAMELVLDSLVATVCKALPPLAENFIKHIDALSPFFHQREPQSEEETDAQEVFNATIQRYRELITTIQAQ